MNNLNPDLLFQRMTRGALRGPAAEEISTMSRCKGKLDTGERCAIHAAPGKDLCTGCETRGAQLYDKTVQFPVLRAHDLKPAKRGRPAKRGEASEAHAEMAEAAKTVTSDKPVAKAEKAPFLCDSCAGAPSCDGGLLRTDECVAYSPKTAAAFDLSQASIDSFVANHTENNLQMVAADHLAGADKLIEPDEKTGSPVERVIENCAICEHRTSTECFEIGRTKCVGFAPILAPITGKSCNLICDESSDNCPSCTRPNDGPGTIIDGIRCKTVWAEPERQITPATPTLPKEHPTPCVKLSPLLAALVDESEPPLPETAIVLDLGEMYAPLVMMGVGTVTILELLDALFIGRTHRMRAA